MSDTAPILLWFRRDLRLADHPAVSAAARSGRPVIPVYIRDAVVDGWGAAPRWRLGKGLEAFADRLAGIGSRLILRSGPAREVLPELARDTGATAVWRTRLYDPEALERDMAVDAALADAGIEQRAFGGHLLFEPDSVETGQGGYYKVYSPYWRAVKDRDIPEPDPAPSRLAPPERWPESDALEAWSLGAAMNRGAAVVAPWANPGEGRARARLDDFIARRVADYKRARDCPAEDGTSELSENLSLGEIGPRTCWHAARRAEADGKAGAAHFMKELVWREFAYHLLWHTPRIATDNWRPEWDAFPWREDRRPAEAAAWERGRTGLPFVDAGLREMQVTGRMHNRVRMIVASYMTKHLMLHWRIGLRWFEEHLIDWDPANNALGWQWVAGSGPDAAPFFRIFNPETQRDRFDPGGHYVRRWLAEGQADPPPEALSYFDAIPRSWNMTPDMPYPDPVVGLAEGRERALAAYAARETPA
jgi:deoxyribodipyrimidine photo-lyase